MADYNLPPGPLSAYLGVRNSNQDFNEQSSARDIQKASALMQLLHAAQQQKQQSALLQALQSGDDKTLMSVPGGMDILAKRQALQTGQTTNSLNNARLGEIQRKAQTERDQSAASDALANYISTPQFKPTGDQAPNVPGPTFANDAQAIEAMKQAEATGMPFRGYVNNPAIAQGLAIKADPKVIPEILKQQAGPAPMTPYQTQNLELQKQRLTAPQTAYDSGRGIIVDKRTGNATPVTANGAPLPTASAVLDESGLQSAGAQVAMGMPLNQVEQGYGRQAADKREAARKEAIRQIKAEVPFPISDIDAGKTLAQRTILFAAGKSSATQLEKQATMVGSFEKNANMNADLALQFSEKVDRTGVPVFNRWLLAGKKQVMGDPDTTKFNTANYTFINEYAKVVSGSMGNTAITDSARAHANDVLNTSQTKDQYKQNIGLLKQEMQNRMRGFQQQRQELYSSLGIEGSAPNTPQATPQAVERGTSKSGKPMHKENGQWVYD